MGCDFRESPEQKTHQRFQSTHPSWGATFYVAIGSLNQLKQFQSTHPSWGATCVNDHPWANPDISIHAPIVGCDSIEQIRNGEVDDFNPRTHRGVRRLIVFNCEIVYRISIHAPIVGCDDIENKEL